IRLFHGVAMRTFSCWAILSTLILFPGFLVADELNPADVIAEFKKLGGEAVNERGIPVLRVTRVSLRTEEAQDDLLKKLRAFPEWRAIGLSGKGITDKSMPCLAPYENVRLLGLAGSAITDKGLEALRPLKKIEKLYLSRTKVTGKGLAALEKMENLR